MKRYLISSLCLWLIFALFVTGCDLDMPDLSQGDWGGEPNDPLPDSSSVYFVAITLSADTVLYAPGEAAEVSGYAQAWNYYSDPLSGVALNMCVSDTGASFCWSNSVLRNTTDENGKVNFTLSCPECAGDVGVRFTHDGTYDRDRVLFLPTNRRPVYIEAFAGRDTLYFDAQHPGSFKLGVIVTDGGHQPIPDFTVQSEYLNWSLPACYLYRARTDSAGRVSSNITYAHDIASPYQACFPFAVGGLSDTACVILMPWDSTHGG